MTLVQRTPGWLRTGVPFADTPVPLPASQQALLRRPGRDHVIAQVPASASIAGNVISADYDGEPLLGDPLLPRLRQASGTGRTHD